MRYYLLNIIVLLVALCSASSIYQTSLSSDTPSHLEDELFRNVKQLLNRDPDDAIRSCGSCINLLNVLKQLTMFPENVQISAMINICKRTKEVDNEVCEGVVREQGPVIRKVFRTMDMTGRDGHLLCASVVNVCPYPDVLPWKVPFPKEKPKHPYIHQPSNKTMTVLHLSDWHIDPQYEEGTETRCDKPICCRKAYTRNESILQKASPWGSYGCDSPLSLIESMLEYIPQVAQDPSFAILTGDIPPHEVWETLPTKKTQAIQDASYNLLHAHFDIPFLINTKLFPSVGNHEAAPTNLFPLFDSNLPNDERHDDLTMNWLYDSLEENWSGWISPKHLSSFHRRSASYISYPVPGLKLISMNTNFCYNLNWWLYEQPVRRDPNGILKWLIDHLQDAEDKHERVWIIGHTPPGDSSCFHDYANYYYQIVNRYAPHVIAGQFFGHTHRDEFQLFYKEGSQQAKDAISISYLAPSITPFPDLNPGFRTYAVDTGNFEVVDSYTYIANLDESTTWEQELNWYQEYSAREAYGSPNNSYKPLSPSWWHKATQEMEREDEMFDKYWSYRYKSSSLTPMCDAACRINTICGMRAGKSELRCDYDPSSSTPRPVILDRKEKDACGISIIKR